jgi:4-amino-4-deoxy-L-arabinose transferase-like glycosyltransferase
MFAKPATRLTLLVFVLSIYCLLVGHKVLILGKHGDGVEYAAIARNLSEGYGTFWSNYLSDTRHRSWHEHPPLVFWIQGSLMKIFGDGPYFEGIYGFFAGIIILLLTYFFWQEAQRNSRIAQAGGWWPVFLLISLPTFSYYMQTNRLAITFMIIALLATLAAYRSIIADRFTIAYAALSGVLIYLGFIAKGPVALFSLAVPGIAWVVLKARFSTVLVSTVIALATFVLILLATFYIFPDSAVFWKKFWNAQVVASLKSIRAPKDSYWYYADHLGRELAVLAAVVVILVLVTRTHPRHIKFNRLAVFFLLIALAGSLPFFFSKRQKLRYLLQSYPFLILGVAFLTNFVAHKIESILSEKRKIRLAVAITALVFYGIATVAMFYRKDEVTRREPFYEDFYLEKIQLPERILISLCPKRNLSRDWVFAIDMQRFYKVSLTAEMGHEYLIVDKNSKCKVPEGYRKIHQRPTLQYVLYRRNSPQ